MRANHLHLLAWAGLWVVLVAATLALRPALPLDETRYLAVAWEMRVSGDFLVPHLNGVAYSHKPPLLFWLINVGWWIFGVSDIWARLVAPAFGLAGVFMTWRLAALLWPGSRTAQTAAPWVLAGSLLWAVTTTLSMFDTMVMFFTLVALYGAARAATARKDGEQLDRRRFLGGWGLFGLGIGLGVLAKGPVVLVFTLPVALLAPIWWAPADRAVRIGAGTWYAGVGAGVLLGAVVALLWAVPAAMSGGEAFARAIFLGQTTGRIGGSFAHGRPFWWYLPMLPVLLFPWALWPGVWRGFWEVDWRRDPGLRFAAVWLAAAFLILSAFTDKQPHYVLPALPGFALLAGRGVSAVGFGRPRGWAVAVPAMPLALIGIAMVVLAARPDVAALLADDVPVGAGPAALWAGLAALMVLVVGIGAAQRSPVQQVQILAGFTVTTVVALLVFAAATILPLYDLREAAIRVAGFAAQGRPVAYVGNYHGQFHYLGRLREPIAEIAGDRVPAWFEAHPDGVAIYLHRSHEDVAGGAPLYAQPFRSRWLAMWDRAGASLSPEMFRR